MKNFHHIKYLEIDGHDEVILIEDKVHNKIPRIGLPNHIIKKGVLRLNRVRHTTPMSEFQGEFCLLINYSYYSKTGKYFCVKNGMAKMVLRKKGMEKDV